MPPISSVSSDKLVSLGPRFYICRIEVMLVPNLRWFQGLDGVTCSTGGMLSKQSHSLLAQRKCMKAFLMLLTFLTLLLGCALAVPPSGLCECEAAPRSCLPGWALWSCTPGRHGLLASSQNSFSLVHLPKPDRD